MLCWPLPTLGLALPVGEVTYHEAMTGAYREPSGLTMVMLYVDQIMMTIFNALDQTEE